MLGDKYYNALFRLAEHWRHHSAHILFLIDLLDLMIARHQEANSRLEYASEKDVQRKQEARQFYSWPPDFVITWHRHFDERGSAVSGRMTYAGCVVMLASNALTRFKDDLDCPDARWTQCGMQHGGHSVGAILIASANGFRHGDEWAKTRPKSPRQIKSANILLSALGPANVTGEEHSPPGRCGEVIKLLACGDGFQGFTQSVFHFAHEVAATCRREGTARM